MVVKPEFKATSESYSFPCTPGISVYIWDRHVNKFLFVFLVLNQSFITDNPVKNLEEQRENYFFLPHKF